MWAAVVAGGCFVFLAAAAAVPPVLDDLASDCQNYTLLTWRAPGPWDAAQAQGERLIGAARLEEGITGLRWNANPLRYDLHARAIRDLEWTLPNGQRFGLSPDEGGSLASLSAGDGPAATTEALRTLLESVARGEGVAAVPTERLLAHGTVGLDAPPLQLDEFLSSWGTPENGLQIELGMVFLQISNGHKLDWSDERGNLQLNLMLDVITFGRDATGWPMIDSADRTMMTFEGHHSRAAVTRLAADLVTGYGLLPPEHTTWSTLVGCDQTARGQGLGLLDRGVYLPNP